jgi:hypothetical protein
MLKIGLKRRMSLKPWMGAALAVAVVSARTAAAQCIMCYMNASSTGDRGIRALQHGILILIVPTLLAFAGLFLLAYRRRNAPGRAENPFPMELIQHAADQDVEEDERLPLPTNPQGHLPSVP